MIHNRGFKNLSLIAGISYHCRNRSNDHDIALQYFDKVLQNDPNNHLCLKYYAYIYEWKKNHLTALDSLDKLLKINQNDSLILCYYGEVLVNLGRYNKAILYFTKANNIDPENIYNLSKRAITYYLLEEYNKSLLDLNKVLQLHPSYGLAYYYRGLTFYTMENINNAVSDFKKCVQLNPNNNLAKMQLYYLECLLDKDKNNLEDLSHDVITKIDRISNIEEDISLLFIRCKLYIELENYEMAVKDFYKLFSLNESNMSFVLLLQKDSIFWKHLYDISINNGDDLRIFKVFDIYMYKSMKI